MKKLISGLLFILSIGISVAQNSPESHFGELISESKLRENLTIIASDAMEGRETGKRGQKMAAAFIAAHFEELGLIPPVSGSYFQPFELYSLSYGETYVRINAETFKNLQDVIYSGQLETNGEMSASIVFVGRGKPEDLKGLDLTGKAALLLSGIDDAPPINEINQKGANAVYVVSPVAEDFSKQLAQAQRGRRGRPSLEKPAINVTDQPVFFITQQVAEKMMNATIAGLIKAADGGVSKLKKLKGAKVTCKADLDYKIIKTENVMGLLEGTEKKNEYIVITAHFDHVGTRSGEGDQIRNGADDDGSGTVTVMELARIFSEAKKEGKGPKRSILFMTVTAEEIGLFGSLHYTSNPVFPLDQTIVNLNIDMIGRRDPDHKDSADYVYVIGADKLSKELNRINEEANAKFTRLAFDYLYNDENHPDRLYYRSDHWNFAKKGIPIIFYFDGIHEDYHKVTDEVEKIDFPLLRKRAQCVFYTAWEVANRDVTIRPDNQDSQD